MANIKNIPKDIPKLVIVRYPPKNIKFDNRKPIKDRKICLAKDLAPLEDTLNNYHINSDWNSYVNSFNEQMNRYKHTKIYLKKLEEYLGEDKDIVLICYEKDWKYCHRSLVAKEINSRFHEYIWSRRYEKM